MNECWDGRGCSSAKVALLFSIEKARTIFPAHNKENAALKQMNISPYDGECSRNYFLNDVWK